MKITAFVTAALIFVGLGGVVYSMDSSPQSVIEYSQNGVVIVTAEEMEGDKVVGGGLGTGFLIGENTIVTNDHVIHGSKKNVKITVYVKGMVEEYAAKVKYTDESADIAVIELVDWEKFKTDNPDHIFLTFDTTYRHGDRTIVIGHPTGLMYSVSIGIVSQTQDRLMGKNPKWFIGTDAKVYPGNSGGPLLDADGEVLGVNDIMIRNDGGSYGFAIPSIIVMKVLRDFEKYGEVRWATLGVVFDKNKITEFVEGSPVQAAGLIVSDQIQAFAIDGIAYEFRSVYDLINIMASMDYESTITFFVLGKEPISVQPKYKVSKDFTEDNVPK